MDCMNLTIYLPKQGNDTTIDILFSSYKYFYIKTKYFHFVLERYSTFKSSDISSLPRTERKEICSRIHSHTIMMQKEIKILETNYNRFIRVYPSPDLVDILRLRKKIKNLFERINSLIYSVCHSFYI